MRKVIMVSALLSIMAISGITASASAHEGWHDGWEDRGEWHEHHWRDWDDDRPWHRRWRHGYYIAQEPVYGYQPQPVYIAPPPPPPVVYYEPQPVLSFYFGR